MIVIKGDMAPEMFREGCEMRAWLFCSVACLEVAPRRLQKCSEKAVEKAVKCALGCLSLWRIRV